MILGASILQLPAILKAKEMGLQVIAVDMDKNAIGFKDADVCLEVSTIDIPNVINLAKDYKVDGIMTLASDMPMKTVAAVAEALNIVGVTTDTALKATNKALMRECLKQNDVAIPMFFGVMGYLDYLSAIQHFKDKFIVKPADNSGSRGVFLVNDKNDKSSIDYAYEYSMKYSRNGELVVEEFMEGPEVSVEALSVDGQVHIIAITDKLTTGAPRFVEMGHSQPTCLSDDLKRQIEAITVSAVKAIGIENGPSHTEIIVTANGPKIVELGARLGGDNITTHLVPFSTGVDIVKCCIEIALGYSPDLKKKKDLASAIRYFDVSPGRIIDIIGQEKVSQLSDVKMVCIMKRIGDNIGKINNSTDRIGFVISQAEDAREAIKVCEDAMRIIDIKII
nr:ATP-grasp domain-containing protein [Paenibacillus sp. PL91]